MTQYIPKSDLVAKIERLISNGQVKLQESQESNDYESNVAWTEHIATCRKVLSFIDTLEVKEVDLEKELDLFAYSLPHSAMGNGSRLRHFDDPRVIEARNGGWIHSWKYDEIKKIAKHFFELGLKAQKGEEV